MVYAGIVAGGTGSRMGTDMPKQFLKIRGEEIILRCVKRFLEVQEIDLIYIAVHPDWLDHTDELLSKALDAGESGRIKTVEGGKDRNASVFRIIEAIEAAGALSDDDILLTHDAVRPFVSAATIRENISCALKHTVCTTAVPATDTILFSENNLTISNTLVRAGLWHAQTPQSFRIKAILRAYEQLNDQQKARLTDVCGIFTAAGEEIRIVGGDISNIKLTTPFDLKLAEAILG